MFDWSKQLKDSIKRKTNPTHGFVGCYVDFKCGCHSIFVPDGTVPLWSFACKDHKYAVKDWRTFTKHFNLEEKING